MNYNRLVIDAIKQSFSEYVSTGEIDTKPLDNISQVLNKEIDRRVVDKEPTGEIETLQEDIAWVKYDLF